MKLLRLDLSLWLLLFSMVIHVVNSSEQNQTFLTDEEIVQKFHQNFEKLRKLAKDVIKFVMPIAMEMMYDEALQISGECQRSLLKTVAAFRDMKSWAVYMLDATAKSMEGLFLGSVSSFGNYDECIAIKATEKKNKHSPERTLFHGKYCTIEGGPIMPKKPQFYKVNEIMEPFKAFQNSTGLFKEVTHFVQLFYFLNFRFGVCVPSTCKPEDLSILASAVTKHFDSVWVGQPRCEVAEENKIEHFQVPVISCYAMLLIVCAIATFIDLYYIHQRKKQNSKAFLESHLIVRGLRCFSVVSNLKKVLDVNAGSEKLRCLHGIRFYSICWIILGHTYFHVNFASLKNLRLTLDFLQNTAFNIISNATLVVDNFFFISGLLMTFVTYEVVKKTKRTPKFWMYIIHRLYRFIPMQMAFVGFTMMLPWFGSGPLWHESIDPLVDACKKDWWTNMVLINNLYRSGPNGCVSHSWYLAADFQIYLICLLVLIPIFRHEKVGLITNGVLLVGSIIICGCYNYVRKLPPTLLYSNPDPQQRIDLMMEVYYTPYSHLPAYCLGMYIGHYLHSPWADKKIPKSLQVFGWLFTALLTSSALFGVQVWNIGSDPGPIATAFYAALSRVAWTVGLAWITWTCSTGHGGLMNKLLCWKPLIPLSRMTFAVYLIHPFLQRVFYATIRQGVEARNVMAIYTWFGFLAMSYLLGVVICVFIESPFISLGFVIFEKHNDWEERAKNRKMAKLNAADEENVQSKDPPNGNLPQVMSTKELQLENGVANGLKNPAFECHL